MPTSRVMPPSLGDLRPLADSWHLHLDAENKSPKTIKAYLDAAGQLIKFLDAQGMPTTADALTREHIETFLVAVREATSAATAATRYRGLQQYFKWLTEEGEIARNPMERMRPPNVEDRPIPVIPEDDLAALLGVCSGRTFEDRRDTALLRVFLNTGTRLAEMAGIRVEDLDLHRREIVVTGKGRKLRSLPLGPKALKSIDRYLRSRARHKDADLPWLWLGPKGRLTDSGIAQMLKRRSREAGISPPVTPHRFRHTFCHLWLASGGTEHDLAKLNGWSSLQMVGRYAASAATERAKAAHGA
jgi:site-specific recombinase XerD